MPAASRHAKPKTPAARLGVPIVAAVALAGVAAAFMFLPGGAAAARPSHGAIHVAKAGSSVVDYQMTAVVRRDAAALMVQRSSRAAARRKHLAAARLARQQAARQAATQAAAQATSSPSPAPPSSGGGNAAASPLGVCIRNAEEGGSYAWGPGNGGGAYQFLLSTWEKYGGAASEYGVAGPAYQDQIFNNAIAAGGASNWTNYDGC
jgi:Transglycosylase-like domain